MNYNCRMSGFLSFILNSNRPQTSGSVLLWLGIFLLSLSTVHAQPIPEVVTDHAIDQYNLEFPDNTKEPYKLVVGSNGALYLRNNADGKFEKISAQMNNVPAQIKTAGYETYYQADENYQNIVYISRNQNIVAGDTVDSEDVFIYNRESKTTIRVPGDHPHIGEVYGVRISPKGDAVAFYSRDPEFGDTSRITSLNLLDDYENAYIIYIYQIDENRLITPAYKFAEDFYPPRNLRIASLNSGKSMLGYRFTAFNQYADYYYFHYDLKNDTEISLWDEYFDDYASTAVNYITSADDRHYVSEIINEFEFGFFYRQGVNIYDAWLGEVYSYPGDRIPVVKFQGATFTPSDQYETGEVSSNARYATLYSSNQNYMTYDGFAETGIPYKTGNIMVHDIWTGETRRAFRVYRGARSYNNTDVTKLMCIHCNGIVDYDISPSDIRFQNNNQHITFEANAWFLDAAIPWRNFDSTPYQREQFVVANPFNGDEALATCGKPDLSNAKDSGIFLWRNCISGNWYLMMLGDDASRTVSGSVVALNGITNVRKLNLEQADKVKHYRKRLNFNLEVRPSDYEGFIFNLGDLENSCIDIDTATGSSATTVRIGKRQIELTVPFNLDSLEPIKHCGNKD